MKSHLTARGLVAFATCTFLFAGCLKKKNSASTPEFTQRVDILVGNSMGKPGHEVLTWSALFNLQNVDPAFFNLPERAMERAGASENPFIKGNYATDFAKGVPTNSKVVFPGLLFHYLTNRPTNVVRYQNDTYFQKWTSGKARLLEEESWEPLEWPFEAGLLALHAMRDGKKENNTTGKMVSLIQACQATHDVIRNAYQRAMVLHKNDRARFNNHELLLSDEQRAEQVKLWLGSGSHTIQDSFSPAHTYRDNGARLVNASDVFDLEKHNRTSCDNNSCRVIREMCSDFDGDNKTETNACQHPKALDSNHDEDHVFDEWSRNHLTFNIGFHMKPLAKQAVAATARFFMTFHTAAKTNDNGSLLEGFLAAEMTCCTPENGCTVNESKAVPAIKIQFPDEPQPN